jgi:transcriptional regulator with XRE-family HTH domain
MIVVEGSNEYDLQGKIIKLLRVSKGWSQQQLADKLLVSRGVVINIEKRGARDAVQLFAIASIFEVDINVFRAN